MSELPITKNEYDKSVVLINFLSEFKSKIKDNKNIENVVFLPQRQGYYITFDYNNTPSTISLSLNNSKFTVKMKVEYIFGNKKSKAFISKSENNNQEIINQLLTTEN